jgi:hypothetical protein
LADHPFWLALYGAIAIGALVYASFSIADLRKAYQTWTGHKRTPFDALIELNAQILFQPRENLRVVWVMMVILVFVLIYLLTGLA